MNRTAFLALACALLLPMPPPRAIGGETTVARTEGNGEIVVLRAFRQVPVPDRDFILQPGDLVASSLSATAVIRHRGAELILAPGSRMRLLSRSGDTTAPLSTIELLAGAMGIVNDGETSLPLCVLTPAGSCEVSAARAVVELRDDAVCVSAVSGRVRVLANDPLRDLGAMTAVLEPGHQVLVPTMGRPSRTGPIDAAESLRLHRVLERGRTDLTATVPVAMRSALEQDLERATFTGEGMDAIRAPAEKAHTESLREGPALESGFRFPRPAAPPGSTR